MRRRKQAPQLQCVLVQANCHKVSQRYGEALGGSVWTGDNLSSRPTDRASAAAALGGGK